MDNYEAETWIVESTTKGFKTASGDEYIYSIEFKEAPSREFLQEYFDLFCWVRDPDNSQEIDTPEGVVKKALLDMYGETIRQKSLRSANREET